MRNSHKCVLLLALFILSLSLFYLPESFALQGEATPEAANVPASQNTMPITVHVQTPTEAPQYISDAIGILQTVATLMGVVIGAIGIIIVLLGVFGFFELREWRRKREEFQKRIDEAGKMAKEAARQAEEARKIVKEVATVRKDIHSAAEEIRQIKREAEILKNEMPSLSLAEKLPKSTKIKLDEFTEKTEILETAGISLQAEDYLQLATNYYFNQDYAKALETANKALELQPDHSIAWNNKGTALRELGKHEEALEAYGEAIELKPDFVEAWNSKGYSLMKSNRLEDAFTAINKAIELKSDYAKAWYNLAIYHIAKHDKETALENLKKAIELDEEYKEDAKTDKDFKGLWDDPDFKELVE